MASIREQVASGISEILTDYGFDENDIAIDDVVEFVCDFFGVNEERELIKIDRNEEHGDEDGMEQ